MCRAGRINKTNTADPPRREVPRQYPGLSIAAGQGSGMNAWNSALWSSDCWPSLPAVRDDSVHVRQFPTCNSHYSAYVKVVTFTLLTHKHPVRHTEDSVNTFQN